MQLGEKWDGLFSSTSLYRGHDYYLDERVVKLRESPNGWTVVVRGSEDYDVFVPDDAHNDMEPYCSCPHYADGHYCKHLAATCFEIEHLADLGEKERDAGLGKRGMRSIDVESLVRDLPENDLRSFLLEALRENERLRKSFVNTFAEADIERSRYQLKHDIERAVRDHLLSSMKSKSNMRACLAEEGMYDKLRRSIEIIAPRRAQDTIDRTTSTTNLFDDELLAERGHTANSTGRVTRQQPDPREHGRDHATSSTG